MLLLSFSRSLEVVCNQFLKVLSGNICSEPSPSVWKVAYAMCVAVYVLVPVSLRLVNILRTELASLLTSWILSTADLSISLEIPFADVSIPP